MSPIIICFGIVVLVYGLILLLMANFNLGSLLVFIIGVLAVTIGCFFKKIQMITSKGILKYFKIIFIALVCTELLLVVFIAAYGQTDTADFAEDAVIVLGAGIRGDKVTYPLKTRLDKAIEYHRKNPDSIIVVTGGKGLQETVTEAYAMEKYLVTNGVNKDQIIKEEKATSTNENMRFTRDILDRYFGDKYKVVVITNNFHIYRSVSIANYEGFDDVSHINSSIQWYNIIPCYLRESLAVIKMFVID